MVFTVDTGLLTFKSITSQAPSGPLFWLVRGRQMEQKADYRTRQRTESHCSPAGDISERDKNRRRRVNRLRHQRMGTVS